MAWACDRCRTVHTQNPNKCRSCGHQIFEPVSNEQLKQQSTGIESPQAIEINQDQIAGESVESEYDSSPDVAVDGSIHGAYEVESISHGSPQSSGRLRSVYYSLRGLFQAPSALLREYIIPILAFASVIVAGILLFTWF
jgi:hypothetical protein